MGNQIQSKTYLFIISLLTIISYSSEAYAEGDTVFFDARSIVALGFFPLGGNLSLQEGQLSTYIGGGGLDLLSSQGKDLRISWLNISGYLLGLNWLALEGGSETTFLNLGMFRAGPHFRWRSGLLDEKVSFGMQAGYAAVLQGDTERAETKLQHGIDLAVTVSWTDYGKVSRRTRSKSSIENPGLFIAGLVMLSGAGLMGYASYATSGDERGAWAIGAGTVGLFGSVFLGLGFDES